VAMTLVSTILVIVPRVFTLSKTGSWNPPAAPLSETAPKASSHLPPESAYFLAANRNKRSLTVNFKKPEGLEILHKLVATADVLVENFIPGKLDSMGLGYQDCSTINNRLIYASITGTFSPRTLTPSVHVGGPKATDKQAHIEQRRAMMS